jgi:transcriptional regulator with XRE-family HTH domain
MSRAANLPGRWGTLADRAGGVLALAALLGVHYVTLERWAHGRATPRARALARLARVAAKLGARVPS